MAKKYYAVWQGRKTGIFDRWEECKEQVEHFQKAGYKSFKTIEQAEKAFLAHCEAPIQYYISEKIVKQHYSEHNGPVLESIAVDASCIGNPGLLEYRGVLVKTNTVIFARGPFKNGTNNIGEFLALVEGIRYSIDHNLAVPIYSDSSVAIKWVRDKQCNTRQTIEDNETLYLLIRIACDYLKGLEKFVPVKKWDTHSWGEIPADYNRK